MGDMCYCTRTFQSTWATFTTSGHTTCAYPSRGTIWISHNEISRSLLLTSYLFSSIQAHIQSKLSAKWQSAWTICSHVMEEGQVNRGIRYRGKALWRCELRPGEPEVRLFLPLHNNRRFISPYMKSPRLHYAKNLWNCAL
jgi:hypothetical protein